ncbi:MAG TPA: hypothetical protein VIC28_14655 [Thermoanaerobaculia bacterium]
MTRCDRFETEALLALERGLPLDEHFSSCPDCLAARAAYERLGGEISSLGMEDEPPVGWQARVWERIATAQRRRRHRGWWAWWVVPAVAAAAALLLFIRAPTREPAGLWVKVEAGKTVRRGVDAQPGDRLDLRASTGGVPHAELRVYRNDSELVLRCSSQPPCARRGDELRATVVLDGIGRYQSLLFLSKSSLPTSASDLETDTSAAFAAGADVELGPEVVVR